MVSSLFPVLSQCLHGYGDYLLHVVCGYIEVDGDVDVVLWNVHSESAGVGKDGD